MRGDRSTSCCGAELAVDGDASGAITGEIRAEGDLALDQLEVRDGS